MSRQRSQFQHTVSITFRFSHPPNRFKVDVNAQQNRMTGIAVISGDMSVVAVEGCKKSIKRYGTLMLRLLPLRKAVVTPLECFVLDIVDDPGKT
ncbi:hypothetical protein FXO38_33203 [Capsicum annuum]|nr:hypothetical protein FXO37_35523 [Capsicum annuum]KAF3618839.1 hypothetical protein FXO38_33203 [Capsicum annuum]